MELPTQPLNPVVLKNQVQALEAQRSKKLGPAPEGWQWVTCFCGNLNRETRRACKECRGKGVILKSALTEEE